MRSLFTRGLIGCATLAVLGGCGGSGGDAPTTPVATPKSCEPAALAAVQLTGATVTGASAVAAGSYTPTGSRTAITNLPAFCRITGQANPGTVVRAYINDRMVAERLRPVLESLPPDAVVVSHGGVARAILALVGAVKPAEAALFEIWQGKILAVNGGTATWI